MTQPSSTWNADNERDPPIDTISQREPARRLALVDDNAEFRAIVRMVAEPMGWQVSEFPNGRAFFAWLSSSAPPTLIMLDMVMPDMDGIETLAGLGASSLRCPVILMTGRSPLYTSTGEQLGNAHGIDIARVLQKPVPIAELRRELDPAWPAKRA